MKKILTLLALSIGLASCESPMKWYKVEISFCDERPKKIRYIEHYREPSNYDIDNYKNAVPEFKGDLNVCEVKCLGVFKK